MGKKLRGNLGGSNGGQSSPITGSVIWNEPMNEFLIESLQEQAAIGNRVERNFTTTAYQNILKGFHEKFEQCVDRNHIKNRLKSIKDNFNECYDLFEQQDGFSWSRATKKWEAEPEVWKAVLEAKREAKKWTTKTITHYDKLVELFGKDRDKRAGIGTPKETPKEKAKRSTMSNGLEPGDPANYQMADENEIPDEVVNKKNKSMEIELSGVCNTQTGLVPIPVPAGSSGKGLPYAPVDWPCPGDVWTWKVGYRKSTTGHWVDRYLYPPSRLRDVTGKRCAFPSRLKVEEYVRKEYPDIDVNKFFSTFIWKIFAEGHDPPKGTEQDGMLEESKSEPTEAIGKCKARNKMCRLENEGETESLTVKDCDICCAEPGFCRDCCCILCCKTVDRSFGGYSHIRCEAIVDEDNICGHIAHLECALRCYLAGNVGGSIGLDVEYYCRRCDNRTDLMAHVLKLVNTCESLESGDEIEPILNVGLCILRGSKQAGAKSLENYMGSAMAKLKCGVDLGEIWKIEENFSVHNGGQTPNRKAETTVLGAKRVLQTKRTLDYSMDEPTQSHKTNGVGGVPVYITSDSSNVSVKLEDEVDGVLKKLKESQESEYKIAEQKLYLQKDLLLSLYRQLDSERSELANPSPLANDGSCNAVLSTVLNRVDQIKKEEEKFRSMKVASGFGQTSTSITHEHFGLAADS